MDKIRKTIGVILLASLCIFGFSKPIQEYFSIPNAVTIQKGDQLKYASVSASTVAVETGSHVSVKKSNSSFAVTGKEIGKDNLILEMAGIPIKKINVNVIKDYKVIPGGQSIGVKLNTLGVLVVGHHLVHSTTGSVSPGEKSNIQVGDIITAINGHKIESMSEVTPYVQEAGKQGKPLKMTIRRDKQTLKVNLNPVKDKQDQSYKLGLYIRDSAAGIGTMTFVDPKTKKYGALGHVISDMDTKKPIVVDNGQILRSTVTSIEKGLNGNPGEKLAQFSADKQILGTITDNSPFGVFGDIHHSIKNNLYDKPMPIALSNQVKVGPAKILTVVQGDKVEAFDIKVVSTVPQKFPATKGMIIKITDKRLLSKTGGIVQGMSGSPIIQNNHVIGAVTHVFVNDPTSGYGVNIEWMLDEAGINIYKQSEKAS